MLSLRLYQPLKQGSAPIGEIGDLIDPRSYWHSKRTRGGDWQAGGTIRNQPLDVLEDIFYTMLGADFKEYCYGVRTWRGMIGKLTLRQQPAELDIGFLGYVHTAQWREVSVGDGTTANINAWLEYLILNNCEFLSPGFMAENTLQLPKESDTTRRVWDEVQRIEKLGDSSGNLWRAYVRDRSVYYEPLDWEPRYKVRAAFERERDLLAMENYILLDYVAEDARTNFSRPPLENTHSTSLYGRREGKLQQRKVSGPTAAARQLTYLNEFSWPWARPVGSVPGLEVMSLNDEIVPAWMVEPAVVRDALWQVEIAERGAFLADARDAMVDEVRSSWDGVTLTTTEFTAEDILTRAAQGLIGGDPGVHSGFMSGWTQWKDEFREKRAKKGRGTFLPDYDPDYHGRTQYWWPEPEEE